MTGTQHSADDSDDMFIMSTESPINVFTHQIIIKEGPDKIETTHPFPDYIRIRICLTNMTENSILQVLKEHVNPYTLNGFSKEKYIMDKIC